MLQISGNSTEFNRTHVTLSPDNDIKDAVLTIKNAELTDRNFYNCSATNLATQYSNGTFAVPEAGTFVRVKGISHGVIEIEVRN